MITGPATRGVEKGDLAFPLRQRPGDERLAQRHGGGIDKVARRAVIGAVKDQVVFRKQVSRDIGRQPAIVGSHRHERVLRAHGGFG